MRKAGCDDNRCGGGLIQSVELFRLVETVGNERFYGLQRDGFIVPTNFYV
jgi:hypothetical protein